jgi:type I restriction enzyme R subunit
MTELGLGFSDFESLAVNVLEWVDYCYIAGREIDPKGNNSQKRKSYREVVLKSSLENAAGHLNPSIPTEVTQQAIANVLQLPFRDLIAANEHFHNMLINGVTVEYQEHEKTQRDKVWLVDFENPENNEFLAVTRFTVEEKEYREPLDLVLFINGLPLVVIAFQDDTYTDTDTGTEGIGTAGLRPVYDRLQKWKEQFPSFFQYNALLVITDGYNARAGSLSAGYSRFMAWRSGIGRNIAPPSVNQLQILVEGLLKKKVLLDMIRHFTFFEKTKKQDIQTDSVSIITVKKVAAYHQYDAVNEAVAATLQATSLSGDQRCGVVWHTQGSGKSMTMLFYAAKLSTISQLQNPTIVVITDRNDLEDQLFETFATAGQLLRQPPIQAHDRRHLKQLLKRNSGGIIFTTVQKFFPGRGKTHPLLSLRRNIIVMADEAHRSQYDFIDGYARHMRDALPNASFIGFTGTPLETEDRNTRAVFGDYIHVYDIQKAVEDSATVPIFYENRLVDVRLNEAEKAVLDAEFEAITSHRDPVDTRKLKSRWSNIEAIVGSRQRIRTISRDLVAHFEQRQAYLFGKAMVVAVSRRVCIDLYQKIITLRPEWHSDNDLEGAVKVVITGTSFDPAEWQPHIRDKTRRRVIGDRLRNPDDPLKMVIVCDMWLTGFDAPCLHTIYIDKPLKDHILMQAIARVNRVFRDKPGGLVVDYLGIASQLKKALAVYLKNGGKGNPYLLQADAAALLEEKYEEVNQMLQGFDYRKYFKVPLSLKESVLLALQEHILSLENGKENFTKKVTGLLKAFVLSVPHPAAMRLKENIAFFQAVKGRLNIFYPRTITRTGTRPPATGTTSDQAVDTAICQIISKAVVPDKIVNIFDAAGIKRPHMSILSEEFLASIKKQPHPHVALELLTKLLKEEITTRSRRNLVQSRSFLQLLRKTLQKYRQKQLTTFEIIEELIRLAQELRQSDLRTRQMELTPDELSIYDALTSNDTALHLLPETTIKTMARELVKKVRENATIDWAIRESIRAKLKVIVKRTLRIYSYPIKTRSSASGGIDIILKQAEILADAYCRD